MKQHVWDIWDIYDQMQHLVPGKIYCMDYRLAADSSGMHELAHDVAAWYRRTHGEFWSRSLLMEI